MQRINRCKSDYRCLLFLKAAYESAQASNEAFEDEIEVDESYFGGTRKDKRGRGSAGKVPVFGLLKRSGKIHTKIIADASGNTLIRLLSIK